MFAIMADINDMLRTFSDCEPADLHPLDAAMVGGFEDDVFGDIYPWADEKAVDNPF